MATGNNAWDNPQRPVMMGTTPICPICGSEIVGPFSATLANNQIAKKWGCSRCPYTMRLETGYKNAFEANPVELK